MALLSVSRVSEWTGCKYRWKLRYVDGLSPRPLDVPAMSMGTAVHVGVAAGIREWARAKDASTVGRATTKAIKQWEATLETPVLEDYGTPDDGLDVAFDIVAEMGRMATDIALRTLQFINLPQWETVSLRGKLLIEKQMIVPLGVRGWRGFQSYFDWVARDLETGMIWLIDHKVRKTFQPDDSEETNLQAGVYQHVLISHGIEAVGTRTLQIASTVPATPKLNKDGSMSRTAIRTDWDTYQNALIEAGLDPRFYEDMRFKLSATEFFRWTSAYRSPIEVQNLWEKVIRPAAKEMVQAKQYVRNMSYFSCMRCWAKDLCLAELRDHDTNYHREAL